MNKLTTAEEFLVEDNTPDYTLAIADVMIRFAKLHVKAALEAAAKKGTITHDGYDWIVNEDSILNAYPLNLIQ